MCLFGDFCPTVFEIIIATFAVLGGFAFIGYEVLKNFSTPEPDGIQTTEMDFKKSIPDDQIFEEIEEDETDHPFAINTMFFGGEFLNLGVKLEVLEYDDENNNIICRLWAEAPIGSTNITVDHDMDNDYGLGIATVHFEMNGQSTDILIGMSCDDLEECDYNVVIMARQSTNENIAE